MDEQNRERASCCKYLTSLFIPTEITEGSPPLHKLLTKQTGQVTSPGPKLCCPAPAQLSSELSRSSRNSLSGQAAEQAGKQAGLDFPLYCSHTHCKRNPLQHTPLFRQGSLWKDESQEPTSSSLRVVSGEKERKQDIIGPLVCCHCLLI